MDIYIYIYNSIFSLFLSFFNLYSSPAATTAWATSILSLYGLWVKTATHVPGVPGTGEAFFMFYMLYMLGFPNLSEYEWCSWICPYLCVCRFCRGCTIDCTDDRALVENAYIAVDWDPTALHLRYQTSQERVSRQRAQPDDHNYTVVSIFFYIFVS